MREILARADFLPSFAEADDLSTVMLGWTRRRKNLPLLQGFAFGSRLFASLNALFTLLIQSLGYRSWAANIAKAEHLDLEFAAIIRDAESRTNVYFAGGLCGLSVQQNAAKLARARSQ